MTDVVSQLEAVLAGIEERIPHTDKCCESVTDGAIACDSCYCDRTERLRREIARVWLASLESVSGAAAFRATQEQETQK